MTPIDSPVDSKLSESANLNFQVLKIASQHPINNYSYILMLLWSFVLYLIWLQGFTYVAPALLEELHRMEEEERLQGPVGSKPRGPR